MINYSYYLFCKSLGDSVTDIPKFIHVKKNNIYKEKEKLYYANYEKKNVKSLKKIRNLSKRKVGEYDEY